MNFELLIMIDQTQISFENTEYAFVAKSNTELKKANFLFSIMGKPWLVNAALKITPLAINLHIPFIKTLIRKTIFNLFVGGETLKETVKVANRLEKYNVKVILDYGVEGKEGEHNFEHARDEFKKVITYASTQPNIPFMSVKITGFARFSLLEKLDEEMRKFSGALMKRYLCALDMLTDNEKEEWHRVRLRTQQLCEEGSKKNIGVLIDAEDSWIQYPVDALVMLMMDVFNKEKPVIYNTIQLYRHDRLQFLIDAHTAAVERNFIFGIKLVRGAYMEKERNRAVEMNYASPIHTDKESCDHDFNASVEFCISHLDKISVIIASHNEHSNLFTTQLLDKKGLPHNHPHVHFSQLFGMSDNITFNLAKSGFSVSKYLPFGPIQDVIPYLMRRAQENSSVSGQTGRELNLIHKELQRRK